MVPFLLCAARLDQPNPSYASLPQLTSTNDYRLLTENVMLNIGLNDRVRITSTTVYRNIGPAAIGQISVADGFFGSSLKGDKISATWDGHPVEFHRAVGKQALTFAIADVPLSKDATHALVLNVSGILSRSGYGKDEYKFNYRLTEKHKIGLFSLAYRYAPGSIFGLPIVTPDLGWEIGPKGASIRMSDFVPGDTETSIDFYRNQMQPLGNGG